MKSVRLLRFATPLVILFAVTRCLAANTVSFAAPVAFNSNSLGANSVATADLNQDGFPDMVVATNNGVSVFLNTGNGTPGVASFGPPVVYATSGNSSQSVAIADINGDGFKDIVVTNMCVQGQVLCSGVAVLLGNGDGTFQPAIGSNSGGYETGAVAVGDLNGDGLMDLVLTNNCQQYTCAGGTLTWLPGNGDGTFKAPIDLTATKGGPVVIGDVNRDGCPDLVTGGGVLLNSAPPCTGAFTIGSDNIPGGAQSIALADLNGDNILDVVVADAAGVGVQIGNGDGTFLPAVNYKSGGVFPLSVAVADLNGDTHPDVVVVNECTNFLRNVCFGGGTIGVLAGKGDGTLKPAVIFRPIGEFATSVALVDADGDGKLDLAVTDACAQPNQCSTGNVSVLLNNFMAVTTTKVTSSQNPAVVGQNVTFTATVSSTTSPVPDGSPVSFKANGNSIGSSTTTNGVASVTWSFGAKGNESIQATYPGDAFHKGSTGSFTETVNPAPSTTTLSSAPNPSDYGQSVTLTAVVNSSVGSTPTGKVTFYSGTTALGIVTLDNTGTATLSTTKLPVGSDSLTAIYAGDNQNAKSTSNVVSQTVNPAQITMTLASSSNPSTFGKAVKFTATLTSDGALPTSGTVTFASDGTTIGTGTISYGKASFTTSTLPKGSHTITATYAGTAQYSAASANLTQQVN